jgi:ATP-binding cassette, subfamily B, bacterial
VVLLQFNTVIFFIFLIASKLYLIWISLFLKFRCQLDYKQFEIGGKENTVTIQLIFGMQEIKGFYPYSAINMLLVKALNINL